MFRIVAVLVVGCLVPLALEPLIDYNAIFPTNRTMNPYHTATIQLQLTFPIHARVLYYSF